MSQNSNYRDLQIWQLGMDLVVEVYRATSRFPLSELHSLTSLLRQTAVAIPADVAEGYGLHNTADYLRLLTQARGGVMKAETLVQVSHKLGYLEEQSADSLLAQTGHLVNLLNALLESLRRRLE